MTAPQEETIARLNALIGACKDREQGYRAAAEGAHNQDLKALLSTYERQSAEYAAELQAEVIRLGGVPAEAGSVTGWLSRGWQQLVSVVAGGDDGAVIIGCGRAEEEIRAGYEAALGELLPEEVRAVVERQCAGVTAGTDRLRALEAVATGPA
jgi:uncharacterized protein (TIGR02284 family)